MNTFEDEVRTLMQSDPVEVPVDLDAVLDGGREAVRGRRLGWTVAGLTVGAVVASIVTPVLIAQTVPAVPAPAATPTVVATSAPTPVPSLDGTAWVAERLHGEPLLPNTNVTLQFADGGFSGHDGCNSIVSNASGYRQDGDQLSVSDFGGSLVGCTRTGVMEQAGVFTDALQATTHFRMDAGRLVLLDSAGTELVRFTEFRPDGRTWTLDPMTGAWAGRDPGITLFIDGTSVSGDSGCGTYTATLTRNGSRWTFSDITNAPVSCPYQAGRRSGIFLDRLGTVNLAIVSGRPYLVLRGSGKDLDFTTG